MTKPQIKGIIWDFGNILARFDHLKACRRLATYCDASPEEILKKLFSGGDAPAKLHEAGRLSPQEFFAATQKLILLSGDLSFQEFSNIWKDIFRENDGVSTVIERIRPDVTQCILSNTDPIHWSAIEQLPAMKKHFSNPALLIRSYTSGTRKPDIKMYRDALACLSIGEEDIGRVLYIEDIAEYRDTFRRMGGNALPYDCSKDPLRQLEDGLKEFGVLQE